MDQRQAELTCDLYKHKPEFRTPDVQAKYSIQLKDCRANFWPKGKKFINFWWISLTAGTTTFCQNRLGIMLYCHGHEILRAAEFPPNMVELTTTRLIQLLNASVTYKVRRMREDVGKMLRKLVLDNLHCIATADQLHYVLACVGMEPTGGPYQDMETWLMARRQAKKLGQDLAKPIYNGPAIYSGIGSCYVYTPTFRTVKTIAETMEAQSEDFQ